MSVFINYQLHQNFINVTAIGCQNHYYFRTIYITVIFIADISHYCFLFTNHSAILFSSPSVTINTIFKILKNSSKSNSQPSHCYYHNTKTIFITAIISIAINCRNHSIFSCKKIFMATLVISTKNQLKSEKYYHLYHVYNNHH